MKQEMRLGSPLVKREQITELTVIKGGVLCGWGRVWRTEGPAGSARGHQSSLLSLEEFHFLKNLILESYVKIIKDRPISVPFCLFIGS